MMIIMPRMRIRREQIVSIFSNRVRDGTAAYLLNANAVKEIMMMMTTARDIDSDFVYCPKLQVN